MKLNKKKLLGVVTICLVFISSILATYYAKTTSEKKTNVINSADNFQAYRLPDNLKPFLYEIVFKIERDFFSGRVNISFICLKPTQIIILNVKDLTISNQSTKIYSKNETAYIFKHLINNNAETMKIILYKNCLQNVNYSLLISFSSNITENLTGFYRSSYSEFTKSKPFEPNFTNRLYVDFI